MGTNGAGAQEGGLILRGCVAGEEMKARLVHMPGSQVFLP